MRLITCWGTAWFVPAQAVPDLIWQRLAGAIVMGTGYQGALILSAGQRICRIIAAFKGWKYRSKFVDRLSFGGI